MSNRSLLPFVALAFFVLIVPVSGGYLEMQAAETEKTTYLGDEVSFDFTMGFEILGEPQEWISGYPGIVHVPGGGDSSDFSVDFFPTGEIPGTFTYTVVATSHFSGASVYTDLTVNVFRPLDIEDFTASKAGDELFMNILMSSKDERKAELSFVVLNNRREVLDEFSITRMVDGLTLLEESVPLPEDMLAGDYNVKVTLVGTPVMKECMFTVLPIHKVTETVKKTSSTFYDDFEIIFVNEGNIAEPSYVTYGTFPNNEWITGLITEPEECVIRNGDKTCRFVFTGLGIGESASMSYRLDYTSIYATYALVLVAVFLLVLFGMRRATAPVIVKRHVRKSGGRHHVVLEIKNPFYHNLSNAIVRDWVSPLANVIHHEIDMLKPLVRRSDAGTELIWKLGDIRPRETRIITYPIKALVQGSLKMPKAYIRYNKPNGKLRRLFSRPLVINA
jgi:hypothetical protein